MNKKVNYVLDADIQSFFDTLDKGWLIKFVEHRVADPRILRLIRKWLNAGVMEEGQWSETQTGTPQGSVISPTLANIYLHYTFDLWVDVWRKKCALGEVVVVGYAEAKLLLDFPQLLPHPLADRCAPHGEVPFPVLPADVREAKKVERHRFTFPSSFPVLFGKPPELDQTRRVGMEFQPKLPQSFPEVFQEALRVCPMLEP